MTELETMQRAKMYMDKLAQGIDPIANREIPTDSALNNVRLARCFRYVSDVLGQVIANGGIVGEQPKLPFEITAEQLAGIRISPEPLRVTQLADMISAAAENPQMKKLSTTTITNWLLEKGYLEKTVGPDGRNRRLPTQSGLMIGLFTQTRQGRDGDYEAVFYSAAAQRFVIDRLPGILAEK